MPFVPIRLDDVQEGEAVKEGEYEVQIVKAELGESKKGNSMVTVMLRVLGEAAANPINHWLVPPKASDPEDQQRFRKLDIARFCHAFGIPTEGGGFDTDDFAGRTAYVTVTAEENKDDGKVYNRLRLPRLPKDAIGE